MGVIPARFASSRFPGKALADLGGKPLIQRVHERARQAKKLTALLVATDDERIARVVRDFGGEAVLTGPHHGSGTDRIGEAIGDRKADVVLNIQGDEPFLDPVSLDRLADAALEEGISMSTLAYPIDAREAESSDCVKVVLTQGGDALYFSRARIPARGTWSEGPSDSRDAIYLKHVGLYGYRGEFFRIFLSLPPSSLEQAEDLEQLRALEQGYRIKVLLAKEPTIAVDRPEDLDRARARLAEESARMMEQEARARKESGWPSSSS